MLNSFNWASLYVRRVLLDGERKPIEPMALRLPDGNVQAMHQFVGQIPWEFLPVRETFSRQMTQGKPARIVDDIGFPKSYFT